MFPHISNCQKDKGEKITFPELNEFMYCMCVHVFIWSDGIIMLWWMGSLLLCHSSTIQDYKEAPCTTFLSSMPLLCPLLIQTLRLKWSGLCCLCLCESLCTCACSLVGWMSWSGLYNSTETTNSKGISVSTQMFEIKGPFSGQPFAPITTNPVWMVFHRFP